MLSPDADNSRFNLILPNEFFIPEVVDKFSIFLKQFNFPFDTIQQVFMESIQAYDMPEFGYTMYTQNMIDANNAGYSWNSIPKTSEQALIDNKLVVVTMRHITGFMTYFMAVELFFQRYKMGTNKTDRKPFGNIILQTLGIDNKPICNIKLHKCQLVGVDGISFNHNDTQRDFRTFTLTFGYTEFETSLYVPDLIFDKKP